ncbi:hypothetical protein PilKf_00805 [Pillotina sp. SPG140]
MRLSSASKYLAVILNPPLRPKKPRIEYVDMLKCWAIFCVLWGHAIGNLRDGYFFPADVVFKFIFTWHMPIFFMISGFFFSPSLKLSFSEFFSKRFTVLMIPHLVWGFIFAVTHLIMAFINTSRTFNIVEEINTILNPTPMQFWFLRDLFVIEVLVFLSYKIFKKSTPAFIAATLFVLLFSFSDVIGKMIRFMMPIFWTGILLKACHKSFSKHLNKILILSGLTFIVCFYFFEPTYIIYLIDFPPIINLQQTSEQGNIIFDFTNIGISGLRLLIGLAGSIFFFALFQKCWKKNAVTLFLSRCGQLTLGIYILQIPIIEKSFLTHLDFPDINIWVYSCILTPIISVCAFFIIVLIIKLIQRNRDFTLMLFGNSLVKRGASHMKIGAKLIITINAITVIGIAALLGITQRSIQAQLTTLLERELVNLGEKASVNIENWINTYLDSARTIAQEMSQYESVPEADRRIIFDLLLRGVLTANPEIVDIWSAWAPNALDGMDADYANSQGTDRTGRYISQWTREQGTISLKALSDYQTGSFYTAPMGTGNEFILDPYLSSVSGQDTLLSRISVPIKNPRTGRTVGVVGATIDLSNIQAIVMEIIPPGEKAAATYSNGGIIVSHIIPERIGKDAREADTDLYDIYLNDFLNAVSKGKSFNFTKFDSMINGNMTLFSVPFTIGNTSTPWTLVVSFSHDAVFAPAQQTLYTSITVGVIIVLIISIVGFFIARSISTTIVQTTKMLRAISEEDGDLTQRLTTMSKDEPGDMAKYFNRMIDKIKALIFVIKDESTTLSQTGDELAAHTTETAAAVTEITANIQSIKSRVLNQSASVTQTAVTMNRIVDHINMLGKLVENQTASVSKSSASVEKMVANIQSVTQTLVRNVNNIVGLSESSEIGRKGLEEVAADIQKIAEESAGLLEINAVMENISSQTNLLSMNAAIEAAHAGEAGKGFAVVANEIRKLAESSSSQSKTISVVLKKIKDSIDKITRSTEGVLSKFEVIGSGIQTVTEQEKAVKDAMEEQEVGSKIILEAISQLKEMTEQVKQNANEMMQGSREVIGESRSLEQLTEEITGGVNEIATGAEQINSSMDRVAGISIDNRERISALVAEVSKFKV